MLGSLSEKHSCVFTKKKICHLTTREKSHAIMKGCRGEWSFRITEKEPLPHLIGALSKHFFAASSVELRLFHFLLMLKNGMNPSTGLKYLTRKTSVGGK